MSWQDIYVDSESDDAGMGQHVTRDATNRQITFKRSKFNTTPYSAYFGKYDITIYATIKPSVF